VTLTFDSLATRVDRFTPLPCGPLVPLGIKIGSFGLKISYSHFDNRRTNKQTNKRTPLADEKLAGQPNSIMPPPTTLAWRWNKNIIPVFAEL